MLKRKIDRTEFYEKLYSRDPQTGAYVIEISLDNYLELFNEWDPAPYKIRDLDPDLLDYLELSSYEIPLRFPVKICFKAPLRIKDSNIEEQVLKGFNSFFNYEQALICKELSRSSREIAIDTVTAIVFLSLAVILGRNMSNTLFTQVLMEGMFVGGWVFLWESISTFFFKRSELKKNLSEYLRLSEAETVFAYE
ncbi:MAG: hypothetical protein PHQ23_08805 [Candidatus Wallbacteria bacterium]|nr:hypothetical protein [Candidatus Wallbacteria bacterium]